LESMSKVRKLRPYSSDSKIAKLDKRTREYRLLSKIRAGIPR
jgi:hypothetical protein